MNMQPPRRYPAAIYRAIAEAALADAIEWEELPSVVGAFSTHLVRRVPVAPRSANEPVFAFAATGQWQATRPAGSDGAPVARPCREPVGGSPTPEGPAPT